jgi:hypothetical protein
MLVKFKTTGSNSAFGAFSAGDLLRCDERLARHLVEEAMVAEYADAPARAAEPVAEPEEAPAVAPAEEAAPAPARRRARR